MDELTRELLQEVKRLTKWCSDGRWPDRCNNYPHKQLRKNLPRLKYRLAKYQRELSRIGAAIADAENILKSTTEKAQPRLEKEFADYVTRWKRARQIVADRNNGMNWAELGRKYQITRLQLNQNIDWIERCPKRMTKRHYFKTY